MEFSLGCMTQLLRFHAPDVESKKMRVSLTIGALRNLVSATDLELNTIKKKKIALRPCRDFGSNYDRCLCCFLSHPPEAAAPARVRRERRRCVRCAKMRSWMISDLRRLRAARPPIRRLIPIRTPEVIGDQSIKNHGMRLEGCLFLNPLPTPKPPGQMRPRGQVTPPGHGNQGRVFRKAYPQKSYGDMSWTDTEIILDNRGDPQPGTPRMRV